MAWTVVFDTNILLSALLSPTGSPFRCLAFAKSGVIQSITCAEILTEFAEKLVSKFGYATQQAQTAVDEVQKCSRLVEITRTLKVVTADPDDDKIIECAVVGGAEYIVTGDRRHLLPLGNYKGIHIIPATDLLVRIASA